jgi:rhodanese-related sulfurtransferase
MTDVRMLSTEELKKRLDSKEHLELWNVQTDQVFSGEMIPRSRRVPVDTISPETVTLPKDAEIVTYCGGPDCSLSAQAAQKLGELGYTNVRAYIDGLSGWKAAGHPIETEQQPMPAA